MTEEEYADFYRNKAVMFEKLMDRMAACYLITVLFRPEFPFPPTEADVEAIKAEVFQDPDDNPGEYHFYVLQDDIEDIMKFADQSLLDSFDNGEAIRQIQIKQPASFIKVMALCEWLSTICTEIGGHRNFDLLKKIEGYSNTILEKAYILIGYWTSQMDLKRKSIERTTKSTKTKQIIRRKKESYIRMEYLDLLKRDREILSHLSETALANLLREKIEPDLRRDGICQSISIDTIKDILRTRDKQKIPFYPWKKKKM